MSDLHGRLHEQVKGAARKWCCMFKFVSEPMREGEIAALYMQGGDVVVLMNSNCTDPQVRCDAVNRLLARLPSLVAA